MTEPGFYWVRWCDEEDDWVPAEYHFYPKDGEWEEEEYWHVVGSEVSGEPAVIGPRIEPPP